MSSTILSASSVTFACGTFPAVCLNRASVHEDGLAPCARTLPATSARASFRRTGAYLISISRFGTFRKGPSASKPSILRSTRFLWAFFPRMVLSRRILLGICSCGRKEASSCYAIFEPNSCSALQTRIATKTLCVVNLRHALTWQPCLAPLHHCRARNLRRQTRKLSSSSTINNPPKETEKLRKQNDVVIQLILPGRAGILR